MTTSIETFRNNAEAKKFKPVVFENERAVDLGFPRQHVPKAAGFALKLGFGNKELLTATVRGGNVRISMAKGVKGDKNKDKFWNLVNDMFVAEF